MKTFLTAVCLLALAPLASAQVMDGSLWSDGMGTTATAQVTETSDTAVVVTVIDHTGFTPPLNGSQSGNSTAENPGCQNSQSGVTNSNPGNEYRVKNGKLQKRGPDGRWRDMRKAKKKRGLQKPPRLVPDFTGPGNGGSLPNGGGPSAP